MEKTKRLKIFLMQEYIPLKKRLQRKQLIKTKNI